MAGQFTECDSPALLDRDEFEGVIKRFRCTMIIGVIATFLACTSYLLVMQLIFRSWKNNIVAKFGPAAVEYFAMMLIAPDFLVIFLVAILAHIVACRDQRSYCKSCRGFILTPSGVKSVLRTNRCPKCDTVILCNNAIQ